MSVIQSHPNIVQLAAPLPAVRGGNYFAPHAERQPTAMQQFMGNLGTNLGTGLGQGVANSIQSQMRRSLVDKTLGMLNPQMSPLEKYGVISQLDPDIRKEVMDVMAAETASKQNENYGSALNQILGHSNNAPAAQEFESQQNVPSTPATPSRTQQRAPINTAGLSQNQITKLTEVALKKQEMNQKTAENRIKSEEEISTPILKNVEEQRPALQQRESALKLARSAIQQGELSGISKDWIADVTGFEPFRTAEGALLKTASKEHLIGNLSRIAGRPNLYLDQQVEKMGPQIGRSREANLGVVEALDTDIKVAQERNKNIDQLSDHFRETLGYVPARIGRIADEMTQPYAVKQMDLLAYKIQRLKEQEHPNLLYKMQKVAPGTPLTLSKAKAIAEMVGGTEEEMVKAAKKLGYAISPEGIAEEIEFGGSQ